MNKHLRQRIIENLNYKFSRSGGKGGQHVNKTETRVTASVLLDDLSLNQKQLSRISEKLSTRITEDNRIQLDAEDTRSQIKNREIVTKRMIQLFKDALKEEKKRKKTKPSKAEIKKRIKKNKIHKEKKARRNFTIPT